MDTTTSDPQNVYPRAFAEANVRNSATTVQRVQRAIQSLLDKGASSVGLRMIHEETLALDPDLPPVAISTIRNNPQAYELYLQVRSEKFALRSVRRRKGTLGRRRLMRKSKEDLVDGLLILSAEAQELRNVIDTLAGQIKIGRNRKGLVHIVL